MTELLIGVFIGALLMFAVLTRGCDLYLGWFDDSRKPVVNKIQDAINAYVERFGYRPAVVLVSAADAQAAGVERIDGVPIRAESYIRPNNFWPGE